jgi:hypothetical protein
MGVFNMLGALASCYVVKKFSRRTLLIAGHIGIAIVHATIALFDIYKYNDGVLIFTILFLIIYENTSGPIAWLYAAETVIDVALGVCLLTLWGTVFVLSLVCPVLMSKDSIGTQNVFFIFSGLSVLGTIYSYVFIRETSGLTDRQKKLLFVPKEYLHEFGENVTEDQDKIS